MNENVTGKTVVVGMSGGVDSSVCAVLLKEQGYNVIGMFMRNWNEGDDCPAEEDYQDVVAVCEKIGIPHYSVDFSKEYWDNVFAHFVEEYRAGYTPNPDILCNREIKFKVFFDKAMQLGADYLATGHYCRVGERESTHCLLRGLDSNKDQSYFLYAIDPSVLDRVLFPIGNMEKSEVRRIAEEHGLITAKKKDSTGICFIGKRNFKQFLAQYVDFRKGNFEDPNGKVVGQHDGVAFYTIGQRKGLKIGGPGEAWFVLRKDLARNVVVVAQGSDHPDLYTTTLTASEASWIGPIPTAPFQCTAKVRYRAEDAPCTIESVDGDVIAVTFDKPERAVTPRQSVVFYDGERCLGGAVILPG